MSIRGKSGPWQGRAGVAAVLVLLAQGVWRGSYLAKGYFTQDDFLMLHLGGTSSFDLDFLFRNYSGHLFPGGFVIAYLEAHLAPLSWPAAYVPVLAMQAAAGALMWLVLTRLLGDRWERVPLLTVFAICPLGLWSTQWWAVAIQFVPLELFGAAAVLAYVMWRQDGSTRALRLTPVWVAAALLFEERGFLLPLVVFAAAVILEPATSTLGRLVAAARRNVRLWCWLGAVDVVYLVLHAWLAPVHRTSGGGSNQSLDLVTNFLFRNLVPGILGGPWTGDQLGGSALIPPGWVVAVTAALLGGLVLYTVRYGGSGARAAWVVLAVYALVDALLVFGGRAQYGAFSGLTTRYAADMVPVIVISLAGAVREVRPPEHVARHLGVAGGTDRRMLAALLVALVYVGSAALTTHVMAPAFYNGIDRSFVDNLRADLHNQPEAVVYDSPVPDDIMISWFGVDDRVSTVYGIASDAPLFDAPSEQLRMVDATGHLQPIELANPIDAYPGPNAECGYNITLNSTLIYFRGVVPAQKNVLRLTYYTNVDDVAILTAGTSTVRIPVHPGPHRVDMVVDSGFATATLRLTRTAGTVCLVSAAAGLPQPAAP